MTELYSMQYEVKGMWCAVYCMEYIGKRYLVRGVHIADAVCDVVCIHTE